MKRIVIPAEKEQINAVNEWIGAELDAHECPVKIRMQIELAVEEIFVNIVSYSGSEKVEIGMETGGEPLCVTISFTDWGMPFNPLAKPDADTTLSAKERPIGGLGILLVKKTMNDTSYEYTDKKNILTIQKILTDIA